MKRATVRFDAVAFRPFADDDDAPFERRRISQSADRGQTVELPDSEYERLGALGALVEVEPSAENVALGLVPGRPTPEHVALLGYRRP